MSNPLLNKPSGKASGVGVLIPILLGGVLALVFASGYLFYQLKRVYDDLGLMRDDLAKTHKELQAEIESVREISTSSAEARQGTVESLESLKAQIEAAKRARGSDSKKNAELEKNIANYQRQADALTEQLKAQDQKTTDASERASQAKNVADEAKTQATQATSEVGAVRNDVSSVNAKVEKHEEAITKVKGELSQQNVAIATNAAEMEILKKTGERDIKEFEIHKDKDFHREGPLQIRLKSTDKKSRYTVEVMIEDKPSQQRDKRIHELLQFSLAPGKFIDLVVNEVTKDTIVGYVAAPKSRPSGTSPR